MSNNINTYVFKVLSFNVDSAGSAVQANKATIKENFLSFLVSEIKKSNKKCIFLISLQEDEKESILGINNLDMILLQYQYKSSLYSSLGSDKTIEPAKSEKLKQISLQKIKDTIINARNTITKENSFVVHNLILYPINNTNPINQTDSITISPNKYIIPHYKDITQTIPFTQRTFSLHIPIMTKASVIQKISFKGVDLYFIASHLSINTSDKDTLGYAERLSNIKAVLKELNKITISSSIPYIILWGGDLNFRKELTDIKESEQLTRFINDYNGKSESKYKFEDLTKIDSIHPTCKINVKNKKKCNYTKNMDATLDKDCYDSKRNPSYCDRILGLITQLSPYKFTTKNLIILTRGFTKYSDHNPIYNEITISNVVKNSFRQKLITKQKYLKYKTKYINLKNILANNI